MISIVNLVGLSIGLAFGALVFLFVYEEISYDRFHNNSHRIYRVNSHLLDLSAGSESKNATNGWGIGRTLKREFPEVEDVIYMRLFPTLSIFHDEQYYNQNLLYAEENFFEFFSFPLKNGDPKSALRDPYSVVLSKKMEKKFFDGDGFGKELIFADTMIFKVTGILEEIPGKSHIDFDILISFATFKAFNPGFDQEDRWFSFNMVNYVKLQEGADFVSFKDKTTDLYMEKAADHFSSFGLRATLSYDALPSIYFEKAAGNPLGPKGNGQQIKILMLIAFFIILLACFNYINLSTARSTFRAREVGLRKVVGSSRASLVTQFLSESFLSTFISLLLAITIILLSLPWFNIITDRSFTLSQFLQPSVLAGSLIIWFVVSLLSGIYPAWIISGQSSIGILKGNYHTGKTGVRLRQGLVIFQFFISTALIISTLVVLDQLAFMSKQDLGFNNKQVVFLNASAVGFDKRQKTYAAFKNDVSSLAHVDRISYTNAIPGKYGWAGQVAFPEGKTMEESVSTEFIVADPDYVKTIGFHMLAGRDFNSEQGQEATDALIINEACVTAMGWDTPENAIGKRIDSPSGAPKGMVIGVIRDYHQHGLKSEISSVVISPQTQFANQYVIRYNAESTGDLLVQLEEVWKNHFPGYTFEYSFLDESFPRQYESEIRLAKIFATFAILGISIAVIGLFGLISFVVTFKTKEIGIRKILGATTGNVLSLISKDFLILVFAGYILALPVVVYLMNHWLQNFAYKTSISVFLLVITGLAAFGISLLTISFHAIRAASADPVKSLRYE